MTQPLHLTSDFAKVEIPAACRPYDMATIETDTLERFTGRGGLINGELVGYIRRLPDTGGEGELFQVLRQWDDGLQHVRICATYASALCHLMAIAYQLQAELI